MKAEIFQGSNEQWYWRLKAPNGRIIAVGAEGFATIQNTRESLQMLTRRFINGGMPKYRIVGEVPTSK